MPFFGLFRGNPLKKLDLDKLRKTRLEHQLQSGELKREIANIEKERELVKQQGVAARSEIERKSVFRRLKTLDDSAATKTRTQDDIERRLAYINNLITVGQRREDLSKIGAWDFFANLTERELEKHVIDLQLTDKDEDTRLQMLAGLTESPFAPVQDRDEGLEKYRAEIEAAKREGEAKAQEAAAKAETEGAPSSGAGEPDERDRSVLNAWSVEESRAMPPEAAPAEPKKEKLEEA